MKPCFSQTCDNLAEPGKWYCRECDQLIRRAAANGTRNGRRPNETKKRPHRMPQNRRGPARTARDTLDGCAPQRGT